MDLGVVRRRRGSSASARSRPRRPGPTCCRSVMLVRTRARAGPSRNACGNAASTRVGHARAPQPAPGEADVEAAGRRLVVLPVDLVRGGDVESPRLVVEQRRRRTPPARRRSRSRTRSAGRDRSACRSRAATLPWTSSRSMLMASRELPLDVDHGLLRVGRPDPGRHVVLVDEVDEVARVLLHRKPRRVLDELQRCGEDVAERDDEVEDVRLEVAVVDRDHPQRRAVRGGQEAREVDVVQVARARCSRLFVALLQAALRAPASAPAT